MRMARSRSSGGYRRWKRLFELAILAQYCVSVDDFGPWYSSLAYLKSLPVDELKIDRSFVLNLATDGENASIVRSTIALGQELHEFGLHLHATHLGLLCLDRLDRGAGLVWMAQRQLRSGQLVMSAKPARGAGAALAGHFAPLGSRA